MPKITPNKKQPDFKATIPNKPITNNATTSDVAQNGKVSVKPAAPNHKNGDFSN